MSQESTFHDSIASMSQDLDFQLINPAPPMAGGRAVTLATMRGVINLFSHYFKQTDELGNRKKMSRVEKQRRWVSYKQKIWNDYSRRINGSYASEQALTRRCSDPLTFLKCRLKRATNLIISDLHPYGQAYYKEIGGTDDVNELIGRQRNVDSFRSFSQPPAKRPRPQLTHVSNGINGMPATSPVNVRQMRNHNHNLVESHVNPMTTVHRIQAANTNPIVQNVMIPAAIGNSHSVKSEAKPNEMSQA